MTVVDTQLPGAALTAVPAALGGDASAVRRRGWLFNPWIDFLCLGGGSLVVLAALLLFVPSTPVLQAEFTAYALWLAHVINHPHFVHSYQIFYRGFRGKAFGHTFEPALRRRYVFAGVIVPLLLAGYMAATLLTGSPQALGYGANAMFFFVGWHYVKQGYGMAMLDAALKQRFFAQREKRMLLVNGYATWLLSWLEINRLVGKFDYWGLAYFSFAAPPWLIELAQAIALGTGAACVLMLALKVRREGWRQPWNGLLGYVASLYPWLLVPRLSLLFVLFVPAFHSLQYLVVVWRFQLNRVLAAPDGRARPLGDLLPSIGVLRLVMFLIVGVALGWLGFWGLPKWLNAQISYDRALFGPAVFLFIFWIFINIHHYFLDSVMWRRENPETRRFLFGAK